MPWPTSSRTMPNPRLAGDALDGPADVADLAPGADGGDARPQRLLGGRHQLEGAGLDRVGAADEEGAGAVAVHPVEVDGDVAVDDVADLERSVVGDPVGDDLVDRGAEALGVAPVAERRRVAALVEVRLVGDGVDVVGGDAGSDLGGQPVEHPAGGAAGGGEPGDVAGRDERLQGAAAGHAAGSGVRRAGHARRHRPRRGDPAGPDRSPGGAAVRRCSTAISVPPGGARRGGLVRSHHLTIELVRNSYCETTQHRHPEMMRSDLLVELQFVVGSSGTAQ